MCGIVGFVQKNCGISHEHLLVEIERMSDRIVHRGPDSSGAWTDPEVGLVLGHRRLSIVDLTEEGHQPMMSQSGRYVIVFNGEIYNFNDLRQELESLNSQIVVKFRGRSDTEIMLACIEQWGLQAAVERFVGMFSFALYDRLERKLYLIRDRMGEKPLYYGSVQGAFIFGSELKALKAYTGFSCQINRNALALYLRHNYIPAPYSIYESIYKLPPGHMLCLDIKNHNYRITQYWTMEQAADMGKRAIFTGTDEEAINHLENLLGGAIRQQMVADVPLGAFLSGGVDSSTVVALMQAQSGRPVKTFTIGFYEEGFNEAEHAMAVARHLGTDHTEMYVTPRQAMEVIPLLPLLYDEPFSDSSQIPTYLVAQLAKRHVTVSLSGDGGDELFGGYGRYMKTAHLWNRLNTVPSVGRRGLSSVIRAIPRKSWDIPLRWLSPISKKREKITTFGDKLYTLADMLAIRDSTRFYRRAVSHWQNPGTVVIGGTEPVTIFDSKIPEQISDYYERMMYFDSISYLPDDILVKVDRAGMGVSLESRIPMLDHRVVEFAWRLPLSMKIREGQGKWLLRQVLYRYVPRSLIDRPKRGFAVPIDSWLRGPLKEWAEHLLDEKRMEKQGYLHVAPIREKWAEHQSGKRNWHGYLWDILMFQAWLEQQGG
ncbi:asparagine synthase (glutamine-hydrolyzing) [Paenibacillus flagellatus]|uniref:asparagine synthase (glutamine-hydrolyzing) n=1 Tax=Paenibacillus flagellatus TaxID=2211139 RepID=A0A2V5KCG6_9BACL|nr:asparagine synthase (glutamine-hydrolyzing) [Paenibacillus flagellatus]PYI57198.1 asparagine synthase (glutamine-hydrolyzing) [Paenibacillus flagellatus]